MARRRKSSLRMVLSPDERHTLARWQRSTTLAAGLARRGKMRLLLAAGSSQSAVAQVVGVPRPVGRQGATRVLAQRLEGRAEAPDRGAQGRLPPRGGDPRGAPRLRPPGAAGASPLAGGGPRSGRARSSLRGSWRASLPPPCAGCWPAITSSPGAIMSGATPRHPGTPPAMPPSWS
jgi:hypothetical protein